MSNYIYNLDNEVYINEVRLKLLQMFWILRHPINYSNTRILDDTLC